MSVYETEFVNHPTTIERLFREYQEWTKQGIVESLGGCSAPVEEIKRAYDIEAIIREDIAKLSDPAAATSLFVAEDDHEIAGCVYLDGRSDQVGEIKRLYVRPAARGSGLGQSLMEAVIAAAREDSYSRLLLFTAPFTEAAQSLYEQLGFELTPPFECEAPEHAYDDLVFMRLDLQ